MVLGVDDVTCIIQRPGDVLIAPACSPMPCVIWTAPLAAALAGSQRYAAICVPSADGKVKLLLGTDGSFRAGHDRT
jgi:hypothetical protein